MEFAISIAYVILFIFIIQSIDFFKNSGLKKYTLSVFFLLKVIAGIVITLYYKNYYGGGDMFGFFEDAKIIHDVLSHNKQHYLQLLTGIYDNKPELIEYYSEMKSWKSSFNETSFSGNSSIIRFNVIVLLFSFGYFTVHTVFICFLSLTGLFALYKTFTQHTGVIRNKLFQIVLFISPTVLIWSSCVLKESLVFFSLGCLVYFVHQLSSRSFHIKYFIAAAVSFYILANVKFYFAAIIILPLLAYYITVRYRTKKSAIVYLICLAIGIPLGWLTLTQITKTKPGTLLLEQQQKSIRFAKGGTYLYNKNKVIILPFNEGRSLIKANGQENNEYYVREGSTYSYLIRGQFEKTFTTNNSGFDTTTYKLYANIPPANYIINIPVIENSIYSILKASPLALFIGLSEPMFFRAEKITVLASTLENMLILILLMSCFRFAKLDTRNINILLFCITTSILLLTLIGFTSPVAGTLVRYKAPAIPFLLAVGILLLDENKLKSKFSLLQKITPIIILFLCTQ